MNDSISLTVILSSQLFLLLYTRSNDISLDLPLDLCFQHLITKQQQQQKCLLIFLYSISENQFFQCVLFFKFKNRKSYDNINKIY